MLSSKTKTQLQTLVSAEAMITEKQKTVSDLLKKLGSKLVNREKLAPLLEKKAQP